MGGRGSFNSAIILAMSSLETCLVLSRMTEEGRVVTRSGVLGLTSRLGKGVVGAGVVAEERDTSGELKLPASCCVCSAHARSATCTRVVCAVLASGSRTRAGGAKVLLEACTVAA